MNVAIMRDLEALQGEIEEFKANPYAGRRVRDDYHQRLYELFIEIEHLMKRFQSQPDAGDKISNLEDAQTAIMRTSASLKARTLWDIFFKMALWRRDTPNLELAIEDMPRSTAIAYSAFRDLAEFVGERMPANDIDSPDQL